MLGVQGLVKPQCVNHDVESLGQHEDGDSGDSPPPLPCMMVSSSWLGEEVGEAASNS